MASEDLFASEELTEEVIGELDADEYVDDAEMPAQLDEQEVAGEEIAETSEDNANETDVNANDKAEVNSATNATESSESKHFQLPLTRIRNLMKLDPDLHIASNEAVFAVTRATELFLESLAREAYSYTIQSKKKTVQKRDVELAIQAVDSLMFLEGAMNF